MKIMLMFMIFGGLLLFGGFIFWNAKNFLAVNDSNSKTQSVVVSYQGVVHETTPTAEYSFVLVEASKSTPITSSRINFKDYVNKKVSVTGQFSGTTLYVDQINLLQ